MSMFRRKISSHLIPIHADNATSKDWLILLEATTIVGPSPERLRVARTTQERKIIKQLFSGQHFLVMEGYDPRIHTLYFCPQLYAYDSEKKLVPLQGEEIGRLIAQSLEGKVTTRRPWYEPSEKIPDEPIIGSPILSEFDSVVVEMPNARNAAATANANHK